MKMKKYIHILVTLLYYGLGFAQNGAKIEFEADNNTIDYGTVLKDKDNGIRTFDFSNTGTAPLLIYSVQSTPNCTVLSKPTSPILPGKKAKIEIKCSMIEGPIRKTITVESNSTNYSEGRIPLKIKREVISN